MENILKGIIFAGGEELDPDLVDFLVKASEDAGIPLNSPPPGTTGKSRYIFSSISSR